MIALATAVLGLLWTATSHAVRVDDTIDRTRRDFNGGQLRIVNDNSQHEGRLEISLVVDDSTVPPTTQWFSICPEGWSSRETITACTQLGLHSDAARISDHSPAGWRGSSKPPTRWTNVTCAPSTRRIADCDHEEIIPGGDNRCNPNNNQIWITCTQPQNFDLRLVSVPSLQGDDRGVLEFYNAESSQWSAVCDDGWGAVESNVACTQLNFESGRFARIGSQALSTVPIGLDDVRCRPGLQSLEECNHRPVGSHNCNGNEKVGLVCSHRSETNRSNLDTINEGALRLNSGSPGSETSGRLEIQLVMNRNDPNSAQWFKICADGWTEADTATACQQMGFHPGEIIPLPEGLGARPTGASNFSCDPSRSPHRLSDCPYIRAGDSFISCSSGAVAISCGPPRPFDVRLRNVHSLHGDASGVLEFFSTSHGWASVCDDGWTSRESNIVCHQLGFPDGGQLVRVSAQATQSIGPIQLENVACVERSSQPIINGLGDCVNSGVGNHDCNNGERVGLECFESLADVENNVENQGQLRITGGTSNTSGRLEIQLVTDPSTVPPETSWFKICPNGWTDTDTLVACRQMGMHPIQANSTRPEGFRGAIGVPGHTLTKFDCNRHTHRLYDCPHEGQAGQLIFNRTMCDGDLYISCKAPENYDVRLVNVPGLVGDNEGVLEFFYEDDHRWGAVCDLNWGTAESNVICKALGFSSGFARPAPSSALQRVPILLSDVHCPASANSLGDCYHRPIDTGHSCGNGNSGKVSLVCSDDAPDSSSDGNDTPASSSSSSSGVNIGVTVSGVLVAVIILAGVIYLKWNRANVSPTTAYAQIENDTDAGFNDSEDDDDFLDGLDSETPA